MSALLKPCPANGGDQFLDLADHVVLSVELVERSLTHLPGVLEDPHLMELREPRADGPGVKPRRLAYLFLHEVVQGEVHEEADNSGLR